MNLAGTYAVSITVPDKYTSDNTDQLLFDLFPGSGPEPHTLHVSAQGDVLSVVLEGKRQSNITQVEHYGSRLNFIVDDNGNNPSRVNLTLSGADMSGTMYPYEEQFSWPLFMKAIPNTQGALDVICRDTDPHTGEPAAKAFRGDFAPAVLDLSAGHFISNAGECISLQEVTRFGNWISFAADLKNVQGWFQLKQTGDAYIGTINPYPIHFAWPLYIQAKRK